MTNYRAILLYYSKGNTTTQIATICDCSRTTVIKTVKRAKEIGLMIPVDDSIKDKELYFMLYPKRGPKKEYYMPDFYLLDKDRKKRSFTKYRAWLKYCRVAKRDGYKAYSKSMFYKLYKFYLTPKFPEAAYRGDNLRQINLFSFRRYVILSKKNVSERLYVQLQNEIDEWCKIRRLDKHRIWDGSAYRPLLGWIN